MPLINTMNLPLQTVKSFPLTFMKATTLHPGLAVLVSGGLLCEGKKNPCTLISGLFSPALKVEGKLTFAQELGEPSLLFLGHSTDVRAAQFSR